MFKFTFQGIEQNAARVSQKVDAEVSSILQQLGVQLLSRQQLHFEDKSRGGPGDDGQVWKPLSPETERRKANKGKAAQSLKGRIGKAKTQKTKDKLRQKLKDVSTSSKSQIGVDIGPLRNSVTPGYQGPDGRGGNVFEIQGTSVVVGYGRDYAKFFDEVRPLIPDPIPPDWQNDLEAIVAAWAENIVGELGL